MGAGRGPTAEADSADCTGASASAAFGVDDAPEPLATMVSIDAPLRLEMLFAMALSELADAASLACAEAVEAKLAA